MEESDNLPDPDILGQEIFVPRLTLLATTPAGLWLGCEPRRGVEGLEAALGPFREIADDLISTRARLRRRTVAD